ncbi:MATE family efflux transporter [Parasulfitobacter algicola]|uniref:MATE family efflux transporter n=1 Tax=Parasulfitobacter algicola TaxID=2614809 RepID=A0ABX2IVD6_9RHOB|nr:MATE family efflux transporter [Sulfitobacter algicola]NSX54008.1 MATE family efflux transporter [Sulfitobacter algicola]
MASKDLTKGPVWKALASVSAPMSFGILAVLSVGIADAYFLGQLGGAPLAAVGFVYPVTTAITSLAIGLSAGANAAISQSLGRGDDTAETSRLAFHAFGLGIILSIMVAFLFALAGQYLFKAMGANGQVLEETKKYLPFWSLSFPFLVVMMITNSIFRANGDGGTSAVIMILAALINIALTPLFIFGWASIPAMGTAGAAFATAIAQATAAFVAVGYAIFTKTVILCGNPMKNLMQSIKQVMAVGLPASFSNAINPAGMALVTAAVATLGDAAVAGFGAAARVQSIAIVALLALSAGIGPVVGQNWGAERQDRAREAVRLSWTFCVIYGIVIAIILTAFSTLIADTIASDPEAAEYTARYLQVVGWSLFGYGILVTANAAMNARSKAVHSMGLSLARIFAIYLPLAWLGVWMFGYMGILGATVLGNIFAVFGAIITGIATGLVKIDNTFLQRSANWLKN